MSSGHPETDAISPVTLTYNDLVSENVLDQLEEACESGQLSERSAKGKLSADALTLARKALSPTQEDVLRHWVNVIFHNASQNKKVLQWTRRARATNRTIRALQDKGLVRFDDEYGWMPTEVGELLAAALWEEANPSEPPVSEQLKRLNEKRIALDAKRERETELSAALAEKTLERLREIESSSLWAENKARVSELAVDGESQEELPSRDLELYVDREWIESLDQDSVVSLSLTELATLLGIRV